LDEPQNYPPLDETWVEDEVALNPALGHRPRYLTSRAAGAKAPPQ
jgi:hypothetical protein